MKKSLVFFLLFLGIFSFSQSKYTLEQAEKSNDPKVVANFIKYNPDHPRTPELKRRLLAMINGGNSNAAKPSIKPMSKKSSYGSSTYSRNSSSSSSKKYNSSSRTSSSAKSSSDMEENRKTAALLTHMFNNDPNSKEAYVRIINNSKCNLLVKIIGKNYYNMTVPAMKDNYVLLQKGTYTITTSICDAKYSSTKKINQDIEITLKGSSMSKYKR